MTRKIISMAAAVASALLAGSAFAEYERGYVSMMGSSTVVPYAKAVGDKISRSGRIHAPLIQASGTGGGIKLFCEGLGSESPDIAIASREMKAKEKAECSRNGVSNVLDLKIGYDAVILAQSKKSEPWSLTRDEARLAFAKWIAGSDRKMVLNPNRTWHDVKSSLPGSPIELLGPPNTSATHDAFVDLISDMKCNGLPWMPAGSREISADMLHKCRSVREDRVYQEGRENDLGHVGLIANSTTPKLGVFGYKMATENAAKIRPIPIDGVQPTYENIASKAYAGSRPLYLYVKAAKIGRTPGLKEFLAELTSEGAWGDKGYLKSDGLIAMPATERASYAAKVKALGVSPAMTGSGSASTKATGKGKAKRK